MLLVQMLLQSLSTFLAGFVLANVLVAILTVRNMRRRRVELHMYVVLFFDMTNDGSAVAEVAVAIRTGGHVFVLCKDIS
jgi:hypothetical protein